MKAKPWWQVGTSVLSNDRTGVAIDLTISPARRAARLRTRKEFRLVGHQEHQDAIRDVDPASTRSDRSEPHRFMVRIVRVYNRLKVTTLKGTALGFFSEKDAAEYRAVITAIAQRFDDIRCTAVIEKDWDDELFLLLDIDSAAECAALGGTWAPGR